MPNIKSDTDCHLWKNKQLTKKELYNSLEVIEEYDDDSHCTRNLKRCIKCGQLYFYEFYEIFDWEGGNDAQYQTYIPVQTKADADKLSQNLPQSLLEYPSIRIDFPTEAEQPKGPYFANTDHFNIPKEGSENGADKPGG